MDIFAYIIIFSCPFKLQLAQDTVLVTISPCKHLNVLLTQSATEAALIFTSSRITGFNVLRATAVLHEWGSVDVC